MQTPNLQSVSNQNFNGVWLCEYPPANLRNQTTRLLTVSGIPVEGVWSGQIGEHFTAWAPLNNPHSSLV